MFNQQENNMKCSDISPLLSSYQDHEMEEFLRENVAVHLDRCSECRKEMAALDLLMRDVAGLRDIEPGGSFTADVMSTVRGHQEKRFSGKTAAVYSLVFTLFFILGIFAVPHSVGDGHEKAVSRDLSSVLLDGQRFSASDTSSAVILQLTGGNDEKRDR